MCNPAQGYYQSSDPYALTFDDAPVPHKAGILKTLLEVKSILQMPESRIKIRLQDEARNVLSAEANYLLVKIESLIKGVQEKMQFDVVPEKFCENQLKLAYEAHCKRWHILTLRNILNGMEGRSAQAWVWKGDAAERAYIERAFQ